MLIMLSAFSQNNSVRRVKAINVNDKRYVFEYGNIPGNNKPVAFLGTQGNKRFLGTVVNDGEEILYMINSAERSGNISAGVPNTDIMNDINLTTLTLFDKEPVIIQDTYLYFPAEGFCQVKSRVRSFLDKKTLKEADNTKSVVTTFEWSADNNITQWTSEDITSGRSYYNLINKKTSVNIINFSGCGGKLDATRYSVLNACMLNDLFYTKNLPKVEDLMDAEDHFSYTLDKRGYIIKMKVYSEWKHDKSRFNERNITVEYED